MWHRKQFRHKRHGTAHTARTTWGYTVLAVDTAHTVRWTMDDGNGTEEALDVHQREYQQFGESD